ncbi:hypothetical protein MUN76_12735 [Leucobacter rhizosphaerae]|uniref:Uncharacterized protein n=1 Tax=Leucobacter rhizosphaerae TaxID=2932245 RepID=A0ABY4FUB4_9MICO|nr:hypothetical protein [Leucobacter rhizosphaerae]UOQ59900.1 hypothetical protein MUN76_12735 [Leucobacter rhizosphaerae]
MTGERTNASDPAAEEASAIAGDETVVAGGASAMAGDETVVAGDETVVVVDRTVVVPRRAAPDVHQAEVDETVVVARRSAPDPDRADSGTGTGTGSRRPIGAPVEDPEVDPAPLSTPGIAVRAVYAARSAPAAPGAGAPLDRIDAPPAAPFVLDETPERGALPSLARRSRRRSVLTLIGYAGVVIVSIAGLWAIASVAFDGR